MALSTLPHRGAAPRPARGFTLIEVLVALFIMAVMAGMAWQGIDGLLRTRDGAAQNSENSLRLSTVITQWEADLDNIQQSSATPALKFDGASLRLTRRSRDGMQLVVWSLQSGRWWRWASPPVTRIRELQDWWFRSQQWNMIAAEALPMLDRVDGLQLYYYQYGDNSWSNAQSSGNTQGQAGAEAVPAPPAPGASDAKGGDTQAAQDAAEAAKAAAAEAASEELLPSGVRLALQLPTGTLTRDVALRPPL
jgi:general secretion pathway protein J